MKYAWTKCIKSKDRRRGNRKEGIERKKGKGRRKELRGIRSILYLLGDARRSLQWGSQKRCHPAHQLWYHHYQRHAPLGKERVWLADQCCMLQKMRCLWSVAFIPGSYHLGPLCNLPVILIYIMSFMDKRSLDSASTKVSEVTYSSVGFSVQQGKNTFASNRRKKWNIFPGQLGNKWRDDSAHLPNTKSNRNTSITLISPTKEMVESREGFIIFSFEVSVNHLPQQCTSALRALALNCRCSEGYKVRHHDYSSSRLTSVAPASSTRSTSSSSPPKATGGGPLELG